MSMDYTDLMQNISIIILAIGVILLTFRINHLHKQIKDKDMYIDSEILKLYNEILRHEESNMKILESFNRSFEVYQKFMTVAMDPKHSFFVLSDDYRENIEGRINQQEETLEDD